MAKQGAIRAGRAYVELFADDTAFAQGLKKAQAHLRAFGTAVQGIGLRMAAFGAVFSAPLIASIKAAADAQRVLRRFAAVFGDQADAVGAFADQVAAELGRTREEVRDALADYQAFFMGFGFGRTEARELSQTMERLTLDLAAFSGLSDEEALNAMRSGLAGMTRGLLRYGINVKEAALEQEALRQGIRGSVNDLSEQEKVILRASVIMQAMTDQGAVGYATKAVTTFGGRMKALRSALHEAAEEVGNALIPAIKPLVDRVVKVMQAFGQWAKAHEGVIIAVGKVVAVIAGGGALLAVVGALATALAAILSPIALVAGALGILAGVFGLMAIKSGGGVAALSGQAKEADNLITRYEELVRKTNRTARESLELYQITEKLRDLFPEYAAAIDGTAESLGRLQKAIPKGQATRMLDLKLNREKLAGQFRELVNLEGAIEVEKASVAGAEKQLGKGQKAWWAVNYEEDVLPLEAKREQLIDEIKANKAYIRNLMIAMAAGAPAAGAAGEETPAALTEGQLKAEEEWARKAQQLRLQLIEDEHRRRLALIDEEYDHELKGLQDLKATQEAFYQLELSRGLEKARAEREYQDKLAEQAKRRDEEERRRREGILQADEGRRADIAEMEARLKYKGIRLERELLMLQMQRELVAARRAGEDVTLVQKEFGLRMRLLDAAGAVSERISVAGTFNPLAAAGLGGGGPLERTARATEATARNTQRLLEKAGQGQVFGGRGY